MQVTLKKARKIMAELADLAAKNTISDTISFSAYRDASASDLNEIIDTKRKELSDGLDTYVKIQNWIFETRNLVADANKKAGIDKVMTDLKLTETLITRFTAVENSAKRSKVEDSDILAKKLENMRKKLASGSTSPYDREEDSINVLVFAVADDKLKSLRKTKVDLEDKLTILNSTKKVEFSDDLSKFLTENGIV